MGKTILTIDDSQTVRTIISKHLSQFAVKMMEAENGEQGVERAREGIPDLILLDYNMPVMDGYHTLVELRTDPKLKEIPVVMVTTETAKETVVKLLKLGLNDYIAKPFTRELLLKKINPILKLYSGDQIPDAPKKEAAAAPAKAPEKPSVLAIDDKSSILQLLKEYLGDDYQLTIADSGKAALKVIGQKNFDYIFLDIGLGDMSGLDVVKAYLQNVEGGANEKKVIAMTLRSSQSEILGAAEAGIKALLYKPFTQADVANAIEQVNANQRDLSGKRLRFLTSSGDVRILDCPSEKSSKFRAYANSMTTDIRQEVDNIIEEGLSQLIVRVSEGFLEQPGPRKAFLDLMEHVREQPLSVRLVAESPEIRDSLKRYAETSDIPTDVSLEGALSSIA